MARIAKPDCPRCRGTGEFRSCYTGRVVGECHCVHEEPIPPLLHAVDGTRIAAFLESLRLSGCSTQRLFLSACPEQGKSAGVPIIALERYETGRAVVRYMRSGREWRFGRFPDPVNTPTTFLADHDTPEGWLDALRKVAADPGGALASTSQENDTCGICGRDLSDPSSVSRGFGPHCWKSAKRLIGEVAGVQVLGTGGMNLEGAATLRWGNGGYLAGADTDVPGAVEVMVTWTSGYRRRVPVNRGDMDMCQSSATHM